MVDVTYWLGSGKGAQRIAESRRTVCACAVRLVMTLSCAAAKFYYVNVTGLPFVPAYAKADVQLLRCVLTHRDFCMPAPAVDLLLQLHRLQAPATDKL